MSEIIGLITARSGSKGIPHKNVADLGGKPLIAWTIEVALQSPELGRVIVSTDDEEIAQVSRMYGAEVPFMRPSELAQDHSSHISVMEHTIRWLDRHENVCPDYMMLLQPTSPFRTTEDIKAVCQIAERYNADAVVSVEPMEPHPYLSKRILEDGTLVNFVSDANIKYMRRQDLPSAYAINGAIYLNKSESLLNDQTFFPASTYAYVMPPERSLDIDTPWDLYLAELILRDRYEA